MTRYLMSVCYPADAAAPASDELEVIVHDVTALHQELAAAGAWVFGGGLHDPSTATVVTAGDRGPLTTDGPFIEAKEAVGGLSIIDVEDLDAALHWAHRMSQATTCPIEVRPFTDDASA